MYSLHNFILLCRAWITPSCGIVTQLPFIDSGKFSQSRTRDYSFGGMQQSSGI